MWLRLRIGYPHSACSSFSQMMSQSSQITHNSQSLHPCRNYNTKIPAMCPHSKNTNKTNVLHHLRRRKPLGNATELLGQFLQAFSQRCCTQAWLVMPVMPWKPGQPGGFPKSWSYPSWDGLRWLMAMSGTDWLKVPTINKRPIFQASISGNILTDKKKHIPLWKDFLCFLGEKMARNLGWKHNRASGHRSL